MTTTLAAPTMAPDFTIPLDGGGHITLCDFRS